MPRSSPAGPARSATAGRSARWTRFAQADQAGMSPLSGRRAFHHRRPALTVVRSQDPDAPATLPDPAAARQVAGGQPTEIWTTQQVQPPAPI